MGFNRRKMEDQRRQAAEKEAAARRATDAQVLEDAACLIDAWNERQAKRTPWPAGSRVRLSPIFLGSQRCHSELNNAVCSIRPVQISAGGKNSLAYD